MTSVRRMTPSDHSEVSDIFHEAFEVSPRQPLEYVQNLAYTTPDGCFVATAEQRVVAYACSHTSGRIGYIGNLAVRPDAQRRGYGKAVTLAARDYLASHCDVVGLCVEADKGQNLGLYHRCDFEPTLPSWFVYKHLPDENRPDPDDSVVTLAQLDQTASTAIREMRGWCSEVIPGLDPGRDLELFHKRYSDRLWVAMDGGEPVGFLAYHRLFRGDPWGAIRPARDDAECLDRLVGALEAACGEAAMCFHFHASFPRVLDVLLARGYRVGCHRTCMTLAGARGWPERSDSLFLRPWWS